jgi:hypothetical protein
VGVPVRGTAEVPVADDAGAAAHGHGLAAVAVLWRDGVARTAGVTVLRRGEQPDDLDVVPVRHPLPLPVSDPSHDVPESEQNDRTTVTRAL